MGLTREMRAIYNQLVFDLSKSSTLAHIFKRHLLPKNLRFGLQIVSSGELPKPSSPSK